MKSDLNDIFATPEIRSLLQNHHEKSLADPIYKEGYEAANHFASPFEENPYVFPEETSRKLTKLAIQETLSPQEMTQLVESRELLDASNWSKWSSGNHAKHCLGL